jgi:hypothetical protein
LQHKLPDRRLPDFVSFVADVDFVHDFGAVEAARSRTVQRVFESG